LRVKDDTAKKHLWRFYEDYAPFWFDTLNRFMVVRSMVKAQEKSKTETAKG
jgi:hypothetical protein